MEILKTADGNITRCRMWKLQKLVAEISLSTEYENHENHVDMTHSQMLGKVEYGLPAKIGRLVGCTEMLS